jgi:hypothetical protein
MSKPAPEVAPVAVAEMSSEEYRDDELAKMQVQTIVKCVGISNLNY